MIIKKFSPIIKVMFLIFILPLASATYMEGTITINEIGKARFNLNSDIQIEFPDLINENNKITGTTEELISKQGTIWTFTLNLEEIDSVLLDIKLPKNLKSITEISSPKHIIDLEDKTIILLDSSNSPITISYTLKESKNYAWIVWLIIMSFITLAFYIYSKIKKNKERIKTIMPLISEKEEKIINTLMKTPKRQNTLRKELDIPKASFTRYLINLEKKKLILREGEGKNKIVKLK